LGQLANAKKDIVDTAASRYMDKWSYISNANKKKFMKAHRQREKVSEPSAFILPEP
jgi:hypothetical protein